MDYLVVYWCNGNGWNDKNQVRDECVNHHLTTLRIPCGVSAALMHSVSNSVTVLIDKSPPQLFHTVHRSAAGGRTVPRNEATWWRRKGRGVLLSLYESNVCSSSSILMNVLKRREDALNIFMRPQDTFQSDTLNVKDLFVKSLTSRDGRSDWRASAVYSSGTSQRHSYSGPWRSRHTTFKKNHDISANTHTHTLHFRVQGGTTPLVFLVLISEYGLRSPWIVVFNV